MGLRSRGFPLVEDPATHCDEDCAPSLMADPAVVGGWRKVLIASCFGGRLLLVYVDDLESVHQALREIERGAESLHRVVERDAAEFAWYWDQLVAVIRRVLALDWLPIQEIEEVAEGVPRAIGWGPGSLSDLVLEREDRAEMRRANEDLRVLRVRLGRLAERLDELLHRGRADVRIVRRHFTELESGLLRCNRTALAERCRRLLTTDIFDWAAANQLIAEIQRWPDYLRPAREIIGLSVEALSFLLSPNVMMTEDRAS